MNIITKFAIGDRVWIVVDSKAVQVTVSSIFISDGRIDYNLKRNPDTTSVSCEESKCFATKDELLKYVAGE